MSRRSPLALLALVGATGRLHARLGGSTATVTVTIVALTKPRKASLVHVPSNPVRTDYENWNNALPQNPVFGDPSVPGTPIAPILTSPRAIRPRDAARRRTRAEGHAARL